MKKINRNTKIQKTSNKSQAGNWIKEAKAKYKQEKKNKKRKKIY